MIDESCFCEWRAQTGCVWIFAQCVCVFQLIKLNAAFIVGMLFLRSCQVKRRLEFVPNTWHPWKTSLSSHETWRGVLKALSQEKLYEFTLVANHVINICLCLFLFLLFSSEVTSIISKGVNTDHNIPDMLNTGLDWTCFCEFFHVWLGRASEA